MRRHLGNDYTIHKISFEDPNAMHIDCTFSLVRPGLAIINPDRPCDKIELFTRAGKPLVTMKFTRVRVIKFHSLVIACLISNRSTQ